jgi:IclR family KDG regulon transcriptional repressor
MSADERKEFYHRNPLTPVTKNTITDVTQLEKVLEIVKRDGIAFDEEEHIMGTRAVAAPIYNSRERVLFVASIIVPSSRIDKYRSQQLAVSLRNCTTEISLVLRRAV